MPHSEEDFANFRPFVSYLDTMQETEGGSFEQTRPVTIEIQQADMGVLAAKLNEFARGNYAMHQYEKALRSYTRQLKLLTLWLQRQKIPLDETAAKVMEWGVKTEQIEEFLSSAYYNRGNTYDELGEYDKAIADYSRTLDLPNPEPWSVLLNRALVYEKLGQLDKAEQDVLRAHQRAPKRQQNIERTLARIQSKRHTKKALPWWKRL